MNEIHAEADIVSIDDTPLEDTNNIKATIVIENDNIKKVFIGIINISAKINKIQ